MCVPSCNGSDCSSRNLLFRPERLTMTGISADPSGASASATGSTGISAEDSYAEVLADEQAYAIAGIEQMLTPALIVYGAVVDANIAAAIKHAGGTPDRLRPHIKTAKLQRVVRRYVDSGVARCKCATTREFEVACASGMRDVLVAYPMMGSNAQRVERLSERYPDVELSVLVDDREQIEQWNRSSGIFLDVNPGMDRTGISAEQSEKALGLVLAILDSGRIFRGLHYYDGHLGSYEFSERKSIATQGYDRLAQLAQKIENAGVEVSEVITSGSSVFMFASDFAPLTQAKWTLRVSPGATIYGDANVMRQIPASYGFRPAAVVATRVVSHPRPDLLTCDAGLKAVAGFAGHPNCVVLGRPDLVPQRMSEEHLTLQAGAGSVLPELGSILYLVPRHAGLTVNNFDIALFKASDGAVNLEPVSAQGHEAPTPTL
jgi:D-serine deaminase-like pyridoxal phosphate-dependent protein